LPVIEKFDRPLSACVSAVGKYFASVSPIGFSRLAGMMLFANGTPVSGSVIVTRRPLRVTPWTVSTDAAGSMKSNIP